MSSPSEPPPELTQKITDFLSKVLVLGSGGFSLYHLFFQDIAKAAIAALVAFGASLMTNFWQGFGGRLNPRAKTVGEEAGKLVEQKITGIADRFSDFPVLYREALKTYCYSVEIEGLQSLPGIALRDVYVPLRIESEENRTITEPTKEIWHFLPKTANNFPYRRIAVVAAPGYGKTTLMRHLAYIFLTQPPQNTPFSLPILLRFREIYSLIRFIPENLEKNLNLTDLILQHFAKQAEFQTLKPSRQWLEDNLKQGKCLVMLDGLDEVPKAQQQAVREWTDKQMKAYRHTQFILTSRPHGFELNADKPAYPIQIDRKLRILDFTPDQKQDFIEKWYRTIFWETKWKPNWQASQEKPEPERLSEELAKLRSEEEADKMAKNLTNQLFSSLSLTDLAKNPLLITMIAATHRANLELPKRRVELYDEISKLLLGTRPFAKNTQLTLTATENKRILQVLAWELMQAEIAQFTPEQGESWISDILQRCCKDRKLSTAELFAEMLETAGLLQEKELSIYEFTHQTFQEYFTALHLREMGEAGLNVLLENLDNERFHEVTCFYAALGNADPLIYVILDNPGLNKLQLANRCKNEGREVSPEIVQRLNQVLQEDINPLTGVRIFSPITVRGGEVFSREVILVQQNFANLTLINEIIAISAPITKGEYQLFLQAQAVGQFHSTAEYIPFIPNSENQFITRITWEDARWFCGWLATVTDLQTEGKVYDYRLPTEAELEKFAFTAITENSDNRGDFLRVVREEIPNRYQALLNYFANGRWREADEETARVMLEVAGRTKQGYLDYADIQQFPCEDLRIIDRLWVKYSGGHFGFSVQKKIWLECGGKVDYETECKLGDRLGWREDGEWKLDDISYQLHSTTPMGHLPAFLEFVLITTPNPLFLLRSWFFSRTANCNL